MMKRDMDDLDLRKAFAPMPKDCRQALMDAASTVKEDKQVKRASFRAVLIAAIIIVATMAVAFAANQLGWVDFYGSLYGITLPKAAEESLSTVKPVTYEVGPMTFTYDQLLTDKHIVLSSATIRLTDGSEALYAGDSDMYDAVDALSDVIRKKYDLAPGTSWVDAAKQLNLPLYGVRALVEVDPEYQGAEAMEEAMWNEDGSAVYFNMPSLNADAVKDDLPITLYMAVHQYDPATDEIKTNVWTDREEITLAVSPMLAEKTYTPVDGTVIVLPERKQCLLDEAGKEVWSVIPSVEITLKDVQAQQYATGIYLTGTFTLPDGLNEGTAMEALYSLTFCDADGHELPAGVNLSGSALTTNLPEAKLAAMTSAESLPDTLMITDGVTQLILK